MHGCELDSMQRTVDSSIPEYNLIYGIFVYLTNPSGKQIDGSINSFFFFFFFF